MRLHRIALVVAICVAGFAACNLNPQPLPPSDFGDNRASSPGSSSGGGDFGSGLDGSADAGAAFPPAPQDADAAPNDATDGGDAGDDSGDAGDAGDADAG